MFNNAHVTILLFGAVVDTLMFFLCDFFYIFKLFFVDFRFGFWWSKGMVFWGITLGGKLQRGL